MKTSIEDAELKVMNNTETQDNRNGILIHVHTCIYCGQSRKREEIGDREINSGTLQCPGCGTEGPLNVEIRKLPAN
jgi:transcription elongation factor Elf1